MNMLKSFCEKAEKEFKKFPKSEIIGEFRGIGIRNSKKLSRVQVYFIYEDPSISHPLERLWEDAPAVWKHISRLSGKKNF